MAMNQLNILAGCRGIRAIRKKVIKKDYIHILASTQSYTLIDIQTWICWLSAVLLLEWEQIVDREGNFLCTSLLILVYSFKELKTEKLDFDGMEAILRGGLAWKHVIWDFRIDRAIY